MKSMRVAFAVILLLCLGGCAGSFEPVSSFFRSGPWWRAAQVDNIRTRARELEARNELGMALDHWRLVQRITVDSDEAGGEIKRLQNKIAAAAEFHYREGIAALGKNRSVTARKHFLAALRLNPEYKPALNQIRSRFSPFPFTVYQCEAGDRPATVAGKIFGDEKKAFLVTWFNHLPEDRPLTPGSVLILPKWKSSTPQKIRQKQAPNWLAEARSRLAADDLEGALAVAREADASDPDVQGLIHTLQLRLAAQRIEARELEAAGNFIAAVPDGFEGKEKLAANLAAVKQGQEFDRDLARARKSFDQGLYAQSLDQSERLLRRAPDRRQAAELAAEARYRVALDHFDHRRYLSARTVLADMETGHEAGEALKKTVQARLVELAQIHYRNGVKHFINEDLKKAIAEWETALACDPEHAKARENIANARRLQKKLETLP